MRPSCQKKVISFESYKLERAAKKGFRKWQSFFESTPKLDKNTKWSDLDDRLILFLCQDNTESRLAIYDLLMGAHDLGRGYELEALPAQQLLPLLDVCLFITDQVRFECIRRLGWIENSIQEGKPIIEQVLDTKYSVILETPAPGRQHPAYREYLKSKSFDRGVLIRRHIPDALKAFQKKLEKKNKRPPDRSSKS